MSAEPLPELFSRALELDERGRRGLLAALAREDAGLAAELERLLAAADDASPLDRSPWRRLGAEIEPSPDEPPTPSRIGPYRIRRELGRGGMGRVYLAQQTGEGFERLVALKVVVPGGAGAELERRFRDERRILAGLEHPGIARFYDAGRATDGAWFLALEYVEGEDLLAFVRRRGLDLRSRVELFLQVLDAVDYAHRHLVVHRDLKPGNVLVGADGRAKLLDFGISKIVDPEAGEDAAVTRTELRVFTPAYASPEQLRGERVTVAADIYSLGVVLYELLAGRRPFARRTTSGLDLTRAELERDPDPPSLAARTTASGALTTPLTLGWIRSRDLSGDLDAITLKALRAGVDRRYPSAATFADDLRRWLAGEPVAARRGGRRYRLGKLVARHRLALGAAAAVLLALAVGLSVALVQRSRALAAQERAEATVADLHGLTQAMLFEIHDEVSRLPGSLAVSGTIVRSATEVLDRLAVTAGDDPRLLADLAAGYEQLGRMFGMHPAIGRSLRQPRAAVEYLERAVAIRERVAGRPGATFADRFAAAKSLGVLAQAQTSAGDYASAARTAEAGIRGLTALEAEAPDRAYLRYCLAVAHGRARMREIGSSAVISPADRHFAVAAALWREFAAAPPPAALAEEAFTQETWLATPILLSAGYRQEALRVSNLALEAFDRRTQGRAPEGLVASSRANLLNHRAASLEELGRPVEALADFKELLRLRAASSPDPDDLLSDAIRRLSETQKAAELAALVGDLDFADVAIAEAETLLAATERQFGVAAFEPARIEFERARGDVLVRRAERAAAGRERRLLLRTAQQVYRDALARAERIGTSQGVHGVAPERLTELRRLEEGVATALRNDSGRSP